MALWDTRTRLGVRPMRALFDLLRGPATAIRTVGARFKGLLTVAIDGTYLDVPDSPLHRARLGKSTHQYATSDYPQICLTALVTAAPARFWTPPSAPGPVARPSTASD
ncbi:hypothetical protein [Streptomyces sp. NPDC005181]|uniref:hypothetical protein n=1 Tax=Streptomyces sp. NPDC005181 TaxID=3156869 RepID=UPI0033B104D5